MKIKLIDVENYKKIRKVVIAPGERNVMLIAGMNKQGKSSLIGAFSAAIGGGKESPEEPIRKGAKHADIRIELEDDLEDLLIHRRFLKSGSSSLVVSSPEGKIASPQKLLDKLVGARFLDPLRFARLPAKQQRETLLGCVNLDLDLDEHARQHKEAYENRANSNREVKRLRAELESIPQTGQIPEVASSEKLLSDLDRLVEQDSARIEALHGLEKMREVARAKKQAIEDNKKRLEDAKQELESILKLHEFAVRDAESEIADCESRLQEVTEGYAKFVEKGKVRRTEAEELAKTDLSKDIAAAKQAIRDASSKNEERAILLSQREKRTLAEKALANAETHALAYQTEIEELEAKKETALANADMPIKGLSIDDERVIYNEVPLSQASGAEQLQVSLAIAAALNKELDDIWVEDGALLDSDSLKLVEKFAVDNDLRIWLERVGESDENCIIIEEGVIKI